MDLSTHIWLWLAIAGLTLVTVLTRSFFLLTPARYAFSPTLQKALRYAPTVAIMAAIAPDFLMQQGQANLTWHNPALLAGVLSVMVFVWRPSLLLALLSGMGLFTMLRLFA